MVIQYIIKKGLHCLFIFYIILVIEVITMLDLKDHLIAKKLDSKNAMDRYIASECSKDSAINSYIECKDLFYDTSYLNRASMYQSKYGIYLENVPIGYLDISKIYLTDMDTWVNLVYAILEEHRRKGYAKKVIREVTRLILNDTVEHIKSVHLQIASDNIPSIITARAAGFIEKLEDGDWNCDYKSYVRTRLMLDREKTR